jgi:type VI secretion system protein VasD
MVLNAGPNLNPDTRGQALSVVVRIYQLKDKGRLELADYNAVWKNEKEALADDLVRRQERVVQPGTQENIEVTADPQAAYIGVVALFRNPAGDSWRQIIPLSGKTQAITLSLSEQNLEISSGGTKQ